MSYTYRKGLPAWNVKIHRGPTAEECASVAAEHGLTGVTVRGMPFGPEYLADRLPDAYSVVMDGAASDGFEFARERARDLFGAGADVWQEGRSGGWLVLKAPGVDRDAIEEATHELADPLLLGRDPGEKRHDEEKARELLASLATFDEDVTAAVDDHPRAQAWALAGMFAAEAEAEAAERAEATAEGRAGFEYYTGFDRLRAALVEYDAARGGAS